MTKVKKYSVIGAVCIVSIITIFLLITFNKDREIIILDSTGKEYYKITNDIVVDKNSVLIKENQFVDSLIYSVIEDMVTELGYSEEEAVKELNKKDYKIISTIDIELQEIIDNSFSDRTLFTDTKKNSYNQAAMVILDYKGNIKAVATGNEKDTVKNRATVDKIKVGSTIKPVAIYTPAIESGEVNFSTVIPDQQGTAIVNGERAPWPSNHDDVYEKNVTITEALQKSKNTIAVKVGEMVGEEEIFNFLKDDLNYLTLVEEDKQLAALALGYFQEGITLDTLVNSYSMFGNGGNITEQKLYREIIDDKGNSILKRNTSSKRVISEETATIINRLLYNNIIKEKSIIKDIEIDNIEILGKTGTIGNDDEKNISQLFVGMTPEYVAGVWVGYDDKRPLLSGLYNSPSSIWQEVMQKVELKEEKFILSNNVKKINYCSKSGDIANEQCTDRLEGYYSKEDIIKTCEKCK